MPVKHQSESYRVIGGIRYMNWQDVPAEAAPGFVTKIRALSVRCRTVRLDDGMTRVFVESCADKEKDLPTWE